jgi:hypothetical protein
MLIGYSQDKIEMSIPLPLILSFPQLQKAGIFPLRAPSLFHSAPKADRQLQKRAQQNEETSKPKQGADDEGRGELTGDRTRFLELMITLGARRLHEIQRQSPDPAPPPPPPPPVLAARKLRKAAAHVIRGGGGGGGPAAWRGPGDLGGGGESLDCQAASQVSTSPLFFLRRNFILFLVAV